MEQLPKRRIWLPSVEVLIVVGIGVVIAVIAIPGMLTSQRASNERSASTCIKTLTSAEADFRANDRDGNHINDFWTGDVSGLYYVKSPDTKMEVKLIDVELANADPLSMFVPAEKRSRRYGYRFQALDRDDNFKGPEGEYRQDTDKTGRKVHHLNRFGFCAFTKPGWEGNYIFLVNENNTVFRNEGKGPRTAFPSDEQFLK